MTQLAPGARALIRDEEWLIRRVDPSADGGWLLTCDGISELVRGQSALFLTALEDDIEILDPAQTLLVPDDTPDGKTKDGNHGWEDLYKDGEFKVEDGTTIAMTVTDDTLPGGPRQVTRTFTAPFARANREEDYRTAWAFFAGSAQAL